MIQPQDPITGRFGLLKVIYFFKKQGFFKNCWGDFRANLGLPGPRGGRRWTRLVPQYGFPQFSSKSGLWEAISWPFFVLKNTDIRLLKHFFHKNPKRFTDRMLGLLDSGAASSGRRVQHQSLYAKLYFSTGTRARQLPLAKDVGFYV